MITDIKFDGNSISLDAVKSLSRKQTIFNNSFALGGTACMSVAMEVNKHMIEAMPSKVQFYENNQLTMTLNVDDIKEKNKSTYELSLMDNMVNFNTNFDGSALVGESGCTLLQYVQAMCSENNVELATTNFRGASRLINYYDNTITARQYIGFVAELNGGYAYINNEGKLAFAKMNTTPTGTVNAENCGSYELGVRHQIARVHYDNGTDVQDYPSAETEGDTLYINSENVFISSGDIALIGAEMIGYTFYNFSSSQMPTIAAKVGERINFRLDGSNYPFIVELGQTFNIEWHGGFKSELKNEKQEETSQVGDISSKIKAIKVNVDRNNNRITQLVEDIDDAEGKIAQIEQTASDITLSVSEVNESLEKQQTTFVVKTDGAYIQQGNEGDYAKFTQKGMEIYSNSNKIAEATADTFKAPSFTTDNWTIREEGNTLNFFKGGGI